MKKAIITGATGMIGKLVMKHCINSDEKSEIVSVIRRSDGVVQEKVTELVINDFLNYSFVKDHFRTVDVVFFCLGVYTG